MILEAFGHLLLGCHNLMVTAFGSCVKWPLGPLHIWPKVERPSIPTNQIARNLDLGLSTQRTTSQSPKAATVQNAYTAILFEQGDRLSKKVWVGEEWKPKL